ncbi:MAG TPA: molybdopterin-dependent oxidoreductase [Myxococcales bacterium]|nr:molybdopterin-dependent oxidoreductase [Myxococcales bacterium]
MAALRTVRTMCPMNCHPTLCGMLVEVEDGRVKAVRGDPDNPDSRGFLCIRGQAAREIPHNPQRLLHPLRRSERSGAWQRTTWDDALDLIAERARAVGPPAVGTWSGHGFFANDYGTRLSSELLRRFANLYGCQWWSPTMICWGLGAFGLGLTGVLRVNTKEDMGEHAALVLLWGANLASQPNTARHLAAAKRRGASVITIDVRRTEAAAQSDETMLVRPGTDAALALGMMNVIVFEGLHDATFVARHTVGFEELRRHLANHDAAWAASITGVPQERIVALARRYAATSPAMILLGGSSMHKSAHGWQAARAIGCLPALTGNLGLPGGGMGPRHAATVHGQELASIAANDRRRPASYIPNQMARVARALEEGAVRVLLLFGTDMMSSFADAARIESSFGNLDLLASYDLFLHDTARRHADVVLPATSWLESTGCKSTNTHLYLMPKIFDPPGEARPPVWVLRELAQRLDVGEFFPWQSDDGPLDALLDHASTGHATAAALAAEGGIRPLRISHVAYPDRVFDSPSGKVEFVSQRAIDLGLPGLPVFDPAPTSEFPLALRNGRTLTHFQAFYDHGRALPTLAAADPEPRLWISAADAQARAVADGDAIRIFNGRGEMHARAFVTDRVPPGTVWMRDGWADLNRLTSGAAVLPDEAVDAFPLFSGGQAEFEARVDVERA